jgi:C-terminal processing protease CtpA/Prc
MTLRLVLLVALAAGCATAPPHPDVVVLRRAFETLHPGLGRSLGPDDLDRAFAELSSELGRARTPAASFLALSRFTAKIRCGHTFPNPYNQSEAVQAGLFAGPRVPFFFRWLDGKLIVTRAFAAGLAPGDEITALGGVATAEVRRTLLTVARADGGNDAKRLASLEVHGVDRWEAFDLYFPLFYPPGADLALAVRRPDGTTAALRVPWMTVAARQAAAPVSAETSALWTLAFPTPDIGYLRMPTWVTYHTDWDWEGSIHAIAETLVTRNASALIVDLRGNEGGTDVGDALLAHLVDAPLSAETRERRVRFRRVPADLRPYLDTWDKSFFELGATADDLGGSWFRLRDPSLDSIPPRAPRFRGKVLVLIDASNSSATFQFASKIKASRLATLIGETTGGNQRGLSGGAFFFLRLPRTGLEVDLPLIGVFPPPGRPDAGIAPDVPVSATPADIAAGRDPVLARAMALANE